MSEAALESQDEALIRKPKRQETESDDDKEALDDIGYNIICIGNAYVYISYFYYIYISNY